MKVPILQDCPTRITALPAKWPLPWMPAVRSALQHCFSRVSPSSAPVESWHSMPLAWPAACNGQVEQNVFEQDGHVYQK